MGVRSTVGALAALAVAAALALAAWAAANAQLADGAVVPVGPPPVIVED